MSDMSNKIIFMGGIHGVGKTTLCKKLTNLLNINHYSASQLIKMLNKDVDDNRNKGVKNISGNQDLLLTAIGQYINNTETTILDGHFCLLNAEHEVSRITMKTFLGISPVAIILLHDSIANIINKISQRDSINYKASLLFSFQNEEIQYSVEIAKELGIPHLLFDVTEDISELKNFITNLMGKEHHENTTRH
jgi:adenylate kinase